MFFWLRFPCGRWSAIATHLPKRTDNEIKNYWNTHLKKRLAKMGIDPVTHKPKSDALGTAADGQGKNAATLSHMAQWESARLEAEARLVRESKLRNAAAAAGNKPHHPLQPSHPGLPVSKLASSGPSSGTPPLCLDVLKAWQSGWSKSTTKARSDTAVLESPTSTLSFSSENGVLSLATCSANFLENAPNRRSESLLENPAVPLQLHTLCGEFGAPQKCEAFPFLHRSVSNMAAIQRDSKPEPDKPMEGETKHEGNENSMMFANLHEIFPGEESSEAAWSTDSAKSGGERGGDMVKTGTRHNYVDSFINPDILLVLEPEGKMENPGSRNSTDEENKNYWNSILSMVNSSSPAASPIF